MPGGPVEPLRSALTVSLGPILKYSSTPLDANADKFIYSPDRPVSYGTGYFGQVGASGEIMYDTRNNPVYPTRGFFIRAAGAVYPGVWDVESLFGSIDGRVHTYVTVPIPTTPTLALRVGGKKVWGTYPFHESAFLGGPGFAATGLSDSHIRGFRKNRFAGDTKVNVAKKSTVQILESSTKRWQVADVVENPDGTAIVVFDVWLKKSVTLPSFIQDIEENGRGCINDVKLKGQALGGV